MKHLRPWVPSDPWPFFLPALFNINKRSLTVSVPLSFIGLIIIWSTTPLAILWSSEGVGYIFGITSRMVAGCIIGLLLVALFGGGMRWHKRALSAYVAGGLGIFGAMLCTYWAARFIPTGWVSLIFGLSPVITGLLARFWLDGEVLDRKRLAGMGLGLAGLATIFGSSLRMDVQAAMGVAAMLTAVSIYSASTVWVKRIRAGLPPLVMSSGSLLVAAPLFMLTMGLSSPTLPQHISTHTLGAIGYLAIFGSVLGFSLFYYVLHHVEATRVALITLVTPVIALAAGHMLNNEPLGLDVILGSALILSGLGLFELDIRSLRRAWIFVRS